MFLNQMKRTLATLLVCALLLALTPFALAAAYPCQGHISISAVLRRSAAESAEGLLALPAGDAVYVIGESGSYYIAEYDGQMGYVLKSAVTLDAGDYTNLPSDVYAARYAALYQGMESTQVRDLQAALIELGFLPGAADGKYGAKTAQAVAEFQDKNGLSNSGSADAATQGLLFEGTPLNAKGKNQAVSIAPNIDGFPVSSGRTGDLVSRIQAALKALDYYNGKVDGKFGSSSVQATKQFQTKNGLSASGVADAETQALLFGGGAVSAKATAAPAAATTPVPNVIGWENGSSATEATFPFQTVTTDSVNLRKKASTSSARLLTVPKGASLVVSGIQGDFLQVTYTTNKASYSGYVMSRYVDVPAVYLGGKELKEDAEAEKNYTSLSQGASGTAVSALQDALRELGFYAGTSTGSYDSATQSAVKAFQSKNGLLQTGNATAELQKLIYEGKPLNSSGKKMSVAVLPPISGVTMRSGDTGYQVTELQQSLRTLGYFTGTVNGTYDSATVAAVKAFQKAYRLSVDGVAGPKVLTALNGVITTPVPVLTVATAAPAISAENLIVVRRGTRGVVVSNLQKRLTELGYYDVDADGIYDADDIAAVRAFQQKNGLTVDGVAGLDTQTLLYSDGAVAAWANAATVTPAPAATPVPDMTTTLKLGSSGDAVNLLQARLTLLKYLNDTIDGRFGTQTAAAVAAFQEANGLTADGVAGPKTLTALYSDKAKEAAAPAQAAAALSASGTLKIGDKGAAVKSLQRALITLGYLSGAADGIYGTKTYLAVEAFQQDSRLTVDGMAGPATLTRLEKASADKEAADKKAAEKAATAMVSGTNFKAPAAREVRFADWYNETRAQAKLMPNAIIYDYKTGLHYSVNMFSFGKHCDAEPLTASDTAIMNQIMGANNWTPHAVWVILSDGKVYMASTHSHGHEVDSISGNGLEGHICIHFPREMTAAEKESMPYALSHQQEILRGWEETQAMIK